MTNLTREVPHRMADGASCLIGRCHVRNLHCCKSDTQVGDGLTLPLYCCQLDLLMKNPGSRPASQGSLIVFCTSQFGVFLTAYGRASDCNLSPFLTLVTRGKHITASDLC